MKKSNLILIIILFVAILMVGVYFLLFQVFDIFGDKTPDVTQGGDDLTIINFKESELKQITIVNSNDTYIFSYSDDESLDFNWIKEHPNTFEEYPYYAYKYCSALLTVVGMSKFDEVSADISVYGFDKPTAQVKYGTEEGVVELIIGSATPTNSGYYATVDSGRTVYIVSNSVFESIEAFTVENLASDYLFVNRKDRVQEVAFVRNGELIWHIRREVMGEKNWAVIAPVTALGERTTIEDSLLVDLVNLQYQTIEEKDCQDLSKYGLDNPSYKIYVQEYGKSPTVLLVSARETGGNGKMYACYEGEDDVFLINQYDMGFLDITTFSLVASVAYYAEIKTLAGFEYKLGDLTYRVDISKEGDEFIYKLNDKVVAYEDIISLYTSGVWIQADEIFLLTVEETDYLAITYYFKDGTTRQLEFRSLDDQGAQYLLYDDGFATGLLFYRTSLQPIVDAISALQSGN